MVLTEFISSLVLFPLRTVAYIDPSAATYIIQIVAGVLVVVGATIRIVIVKIKKNAKDKLNIDIDKKKYVEEDSIEFLNGKTENDK